MVETIDPAWAKDANNEAIPTHYEIRGNALVQIVEFNERTAFPVVANPTSHPDKTKVYYLNKKQTKKVRDQYTGSNAKVISEGIIAVATGVVNTAVGAGWSIIVIADGLYTNSKFKTWDKIYSNFPSSKKYVKITAKWKWHSGHKTYYPTGRLKTKYVNSK